MHSGTGYWIGLSAGTRPLRHRFVEQMCMRAAQQGIGAVFTTCWRSFVLKNVAPEHLPEWRMLLGRHGVRVRHVDAALHWQVCERLPEARELAGTMIARLSRRSIVTSGLSFAVTDDPTRHEVAVAIQPLSDERLPFSRLRRRYAVRHREGFDRHNPGWLTYARRLRERDLAASLATLTRRFYRDDGEPPAAALPAEPPEPPARRALRNLVVRRLRQRVRPRLRRPAWGSRTRHRVCGPAPRLALPGMRRPARRLPTPAAPPAPGWSQLIYEFRSEAMRLGDFSEHGIRALTAQHTAHTGQEFAEGALELIVTRTGGQPWLVNALCYDACFRHKPGRDRGRPITADAILEAQERLILRRDTHIDDLGNKIVWPQGARVRRWVVECKVRSGDLERAIAEGIEQTRAYMDRSAAEAGHLIVFDRAPERSWEQKIYRRKAPPGPERRSRCGACDSGDCRLSCSGGPPLPLRIGAAVQRTYVATFVSCPSSCSGGPP